MVTGILGVLAVMTVWFCFELFRDILKHKDSLEPETNPLIAGSIGFTTNFFDALGIGSFAPTAALLKAFKQINDRIIPGTLNVSCALSCITQAFIFIKAIESEPITLISMLAASTLGAWLGAGFVAKLPKKKIQFGMAIALFATAFLMLAGQMKWMPGGGTAIGLTGIKFIIAIVGNFALGALMTLGIGLYAPCMALVYFLGMSPAVAFPIMMGSCAFLMPVASIKFIKENAYNRKVAFSIAIPGAIGVIIAANIVKSLPLDTLRWLVIVVVFYTSVTMLLASRKKEILEEV